MYQQRLTRLAHPANDAPAATVAERGLRQALAIAHPELDVISVAVKQADLKM